LTLALALGKTRAGIAAVRDRPFGAAIAVGTVGWATYAWAARPLFAQGDQAWFLDVARHVAAGDGVRTSIIVPAYLAASRGAPIDQNPFFLYPPGYPLLLGAAAKLAGASELTALVLHGIFFVLLLALTYVLARRFVDPLAAALVVVLLGLQPSLLQLATVQHSTDLPFAVLLIGAAVLIVRAPAARPLLSAAAAGAVLASAQTFRFNAVALVPAFGSLVWMQEGRVPPAKRVAAFLGAWAACVFVLLQLSQAGGTTPTFSVNLLLIDTPGSPGLSIESDPNMPSLPVVLQQRAIDIVAKGIAGLRFYLERFPEVGHPVTTGGGLLAGLLLVGRGSARPLVVFAALATMSTVAVAAIVAFDVRYLLVLLPVYILLVILAVRTYVGDMRVAAGVLLTLTLLVWAGETARLARDESIRATFAAEFRALAAYVRETSEPGDWIGSDLFRQIPWHTGIPSIRLPNRVDELVSIARLRRPVTRLVLTNTQITPTRRNFPDPQWERALEGGIVPGFDLERSFQGETLRAVVLRAR
jgi:hypothetical protein